MANVIFKRGTKSQIESAQKQDGALSFAVDEGRIYLDYLDSNDQVVRKEFYSGKLTFGTHVYDGTADVNIQIYNGNLREE